jgi:hypothetical protein
MAKPVHWDKLVEVIPFAWIKEQVEAQNEQEWLFTPGQLLLENGYDFV